MLDNYKDGQPVVYKILYNGIKNNAYNHAYLFNTNNYLYAQEMILAFIKAIICPQKNTMNKECENCSICYRINENKHPEIKIVQPDGMWIKKEQLIELQQKVSVKALEGEVKIYIIQSAEKMNKAASNCMLKFLEEPEENIIAILVTNETHKLLPTIISRCQNIIFKHPKIEENPKTPLDITTTKIKMFSLGKESNEIGNREIKTKIDTVVKFVSEFETQRIDVVLNIKKMWHDHFKTKDAVILALDIMLYFYKDALNYSSLVRVEIFDDYLNEVKSVAASNKNKEIIGKIDEILKIQKDINSNVNLNLIIDKLIIKLERCAI